MSAFSLLRQNPNYRRLWVGQVVSEIGDHFNSIACLSLTLKLTGSGLAVGGVFMARTLPYLVAGPLAGLVLDRFDRRKVMLASDIARALIALIFILAPISGAVWVLWACSSLLMFASPFFSSGRQAILPTIARPEELHTANALTQTTSWLTLTLGTLFGGASAMAFGYEWAFVVNSVSFLFSGWMIARIRAPRGSFQAARSGVMPHPWRDFVEGLAYLRHTPLVLAIGLAQVGWASGGGAAQILFTLFGEVVYGKGPAGVGFLWSTAGVGLVIGGITGHRLGARLGFEGYKRTIGVCFVVLGVSYILFSVMPTIGLAAVFILCSRVAMGINNVLNRTALLTHVPNALRGRVFSTMETLLNVTMTGSVAVAGAFVDRVGIREVGVASGALCGLTAVFWVLANVTGRLPEPERSAGPAEPEEASHPA